MTRTSSFVPGNLPTAFRLEVQLDTKERMQMDTLVMFLLASLAIFVFFSDDDRAEGDRLQ